MTFGEIIRKSREHKKWSQEMLARTLKKEYGLKVSASYISMIETGARDNISSNIVNGLLNCFNLPLEAASSLFTCPVNFQEYQVEKETAAVHEKQIKHLASISGSGNLEGYSELPVEAQNLLKEYFGFLTAKYSSK